MQRLTTLPWHPAPEPDDPEPTEETPDALAPLVEAACGGDLDAWASLYRECFDALYRHVCYLTGEPTLAEDLVQDTFARAMISVDKFGARSTFIAWLHGIAINVVRMHWRKTGTVRRTSDRLRDVKRVLSSGEQLRESPDGHDLRRRQLNALYAVLETLPEHLREAFVLREFEGLSPAEAGERVGVSAGNFSVRCHRARARIRDELERLGWLSEAEEQ